MQWLQERGSFAEKSAPHDSGVVAVDLVGVVPDAAEIDVALEAGGLKAALDACLDARQAARAATDDAHALHFATRHSSQNLEQYDY